MFQCREYLYDLAGSRSLLTGLTFDITTTFTPRPKQMLKHIITETFKDNIRRFEIIKKGNVENGPKTAQ